MNAAKYGATISMHQKTVTTLSIVDSVFSGLSHGQARRKLVVELQKHAGVHVQIIEHLHHAGVPDLNVCVRGQEAWIELKVREDRVSSAQLLWASLRIQAGGRCFIVRFIDKKATLYDMRDAHKAGVIFDTTKDLVDAFVESMARYV